jgi:cytochrome P450
MWYRSMPIRLTTRCAERFSHRCSPRPRSGSVKHTSGPRPLDVSYDRGNQFNIIFGLGAHRCVGTHLARLEMRLLLDEWLSRIPELQLRPGTAVTVRGGSVWAPQHVPLRWTA